ncbi:sensor histidine kinase [Hongsoonwoonella zoysiae]|uniref:sensor histidine kinase n=1 Tax=Hongsoonwoonella zoysiae TaxID=2821844 RepID=UPI001AEE212D|nr:PAS domain-containing sensor histidine kinase [Hongsoonwoonella zoysiae]
MPADGLQHARQRASWHGRSLKRLARAGANVLALTTAINPAFAMSALPGLASPGVDALKVVWLSATGGAIAFAVTTATVLVVNRRKSANDFATVRRQNASLKARLDRLESLIDSEDQRLVMWSGRDEEPMIAGALSEDSGVPRGDAQLLAFGQWLEPASAQELERALDRLRANGEGFTMRLTTRTGGLLQASGRPSAGAAVLKLCDLTGERRAQALLNEKYAAVSAELAATRELFDALSGPAWARDVDGKLTWANAAYAKAVDAGTVRQALEAGTDILDGNARKVITAGRGEDGISRGRLPVVAGGKRRIFEVTEAATQAGSFGIAIDISELENAQRELKRTVEFHARTLDELATAVAIFSADHKLQFYNSAFRTLFDLDPAFLEGQPEEGAILDALRAARKLPEQADYRGWRAKHLDSYRSLEAKEYWWHLPDGRTLRVIANPHPKGGVTYIYENVTERLDLESRYNALTRVQGETLDNLSEGVAVFGSDGRLKLFNPTFSGIWKLDGRVLDESPHIKAIAERISGDEDVADAWHALTLAVTGLADNREPVTGRLERGDGDVVDYATVPLPDGGTLVTFVNVTDSVNVERVLLEKNEALEAADQLKNAFIQHISYELRSPLTNIIGFAQLLSDTKFGPLTEKQAEYTDYILSSSSALLAIINDILDLATIDAGIMELDLSDVDVAKTVTAAIEGLKDRLQDAGITIRADVPKDIGTLQADERRLRQVLFNLISNAVRYSEDGGTIDISCRRLPDSIEFEVRDHGCGIPDDLLDQVFGRFVGRDTGARRRGAGLGLSIVKSFVELHGGTVDIQSKEGDGTSVTCRLPLSPQAVRHAAE